MQGWQEGKYENTLISATPKVSFSSFLSFYLQVSLCSIRSLFFLAIPFCVFYDWMNWYLGYISFETRNRKKERFFFLLFSSLLGIITSNLFLGWFDFLMRNGKMHIFLDLLLFLCSVFLFFLHFNFILHWIGSDWVGLIFQIKSGERVRLTTKTSLSNAW